MSADLPVQILEWIVTRCFGDGGFGDDGGGLQLKHRDPLTNRWELVAEWPCTTEVDPELLTTAIVQAANAEAHGAGSGTHRFVVHALKDGHEKFFAKRTFGIGVDIDDEEVITEQVANEKTLLSDTRRHLEATQKTFAGMLPSYVHGVNMNMRMLAEENHTLRNTSIQTYELLKDLIEEKDRRRVEDDIAIAASQRNARLMQRFERVALLAAPHIFKKLGIGQSDPEPEVDEEEPGQLPDREVG